MMDYLRPFYPTWNAASLPADLDLLPDRKLTHPGMETLGTRFSGNGLDPTIDILLRLGGKICPGTQLTFTDYHPAENFRLELDIPSISRDRYLAR
jgi:hypothetical protein